MNAALCILGCISLVCAGMTLVEHGALLLVPVVWLWRLVREES